MKVTTALLTLGLLLGSTSLVTGQGIMTVSAVLAECPDIPEGIACPGVATEFLGAVPSPSDAQIVNLVQALAEAAQQPAVTLPICLNTADGMRVLADGVENEGDAARIREIADTLCLDTGTAAIGAGGPGTSLSDDVGGNGGSPVGDDTGPGPDDDDDTGPGPDDDDCVSGDHPHSGVDEGLSGVDPEHC